MERGTRRLTLAAITSRVGRLPVGEALAVVLAVGDRLEWRVAPPAADGILLASDGTVDMAPWAEPEPADARAYAHFLHDLLPEAGEGDAAQVPGGLRLAVARALGLIDLPPFATPAAFATNLRRFARETPNEAIARMVGRLTVSTDMPPPQPSVQQTDSRTQPWVERRGNAPRVDVLRRLLQEADLERLELLESARHVPPAAPLHAVRTASRTPTAPESDAPDLPLHDRARAAHRDLTLVRGNTVAAPRPDPPFIGPPQAHGSRRALAAMAVTLALALSFGGSYFVVRHLHDQSVANTRVLAPSVQPGVPDASDPRVVTTDAGDVPREEPAAADSPAASAPEGTSGTRAPALARASAAYALPLDLGRTYSPSFAPEGDSVYFHSEDAGGSRLMRARLDEGGAIAQVTTLLDDGARNFHPRVSPDGLWIAFDSDRDGERAVYLSRRDGSGVRRMSAPGYAAVPTWAPDARTLAIVRAEPGKPRVWNLWALDVRTGAERRLTRHASGQTWPGAWLDDGRLAYTHEDRLYLLDTRSGAHEVFASPRRGRMVRTATVSPDRRRIAFQVHRDGMWVLDLRDGSMRRVLDDPTAEEFAWAPSGTHVAYHSRRAGRWGIWVAEAP